VIRRFDLKRVRRRKNGKSGKHATCGLEFSAMMQNFNTSGRGWDRDVDRPAAVFGVITIGVIGSIVFLLLPMLIGAFSEDLPLSAQQVGLLGSADMSGMFVAAVAATVWIRNSNWRTIAALACGLLVVCHVLSGFVQEFLPLFLIRAGAGFAGGSIMSIALTSLGDSRHPDRWFALFIAGQLSLGALGLWLFPGMLAQFGLRGVFIALAAVVLASALLIPFMPQRGREIQPVAASGSRGRALLPGVMALLACFIFNLGVMAVWAYLERMGNAAGLEASFIGSTLAISLLAALAGALLAAAMEDRFGRVLPLVITLLAQAIALWLLGGDLSGNAFIVGVMLFSFAWNFPVAYQLAITVSVDVSGRLVVLFLAAIKLGYAVAPAIAAQLIVLGGGFAPVMVLGAAGFAASALIFISLALMKKQPLKGPRHSQD
jgi:predicted MFS family arabinose efflux permease